MAHAEPPPEGCVVTFGAIADVQYWDGDDAYNFAKTALRRYRNSLIGVDVAVEAFQAADVSVIVQLGDIIDGKCAGDKDGKGRTAEEAIEAVLQRLAKIESSKTTLHLIGNHELYNFDRATLQERLGCPPYGVYRPVKGWAFISLDPYDLSTIRPAQPHTAEEAFKYLEERNPNDVRHAANWVEGLEGRDKRFVPYNGGVGRAQLAWLRNELMGCVVSGESVLALCHVPVSEEASDPSCLVWNFEELLAVLQEHRCVKAVFSGHCHDGGHFTDASGLHHVTVASPLESDHAEGAYGVVHLCKERIVVRGGGRQSSLDLPIRV